MPITPRPSIEDFLGRYPDFQDVDEQRIDRVLEQADEAVGETWITADAPRALMALAAHWLFIEISDAYVLGTSLSGQRTAGPVAHETVGPLSVAYRQYLTGGPASSANVTREGTEFTDSPYGVEFLGYLKRSFPPALVV